MKYVISMNEVHVFDTSKKVAYRITNDKKIYSFTFDKMNAMKKDYIGCNRIYKPFMLLEYQDLIEGKKVDNMSDNEKYTSILKEVNRIISTV